MTKKNHDKAEFDEYKITYSKDINEAISFIGQGQDFFTKVKADYLLDIIDNIQKEERFFQVLDVGCGHGLIHPYLKSRNTPITLHGVDVAGEVIDIARTNNNDVMYEIYDGNILPYKDNEFDLVFAICVVHHVPPSERENFFCELKRVLKPGGILVIFEHNPLNPITLKVVNSCEMDRDAVLVRQCSLKKLLLRCGYKSSFGKFILFTPFSSYFFRLLDKLLARIPFGAQYYVVAIKS